MKFMLDRTKKPLETGRINFELPIIGELKLSGVKRCLFAEKFELPIVKMNLIFDSGSKFDSAGKFGLSYLTALLIDEGAGSYNALELSDEFEFLGSNFSISVTEDSIIFSILSLKENFERTLELLCFILKSPHFKQSEFDREQKNHISKLMQLRNQPDFTAGNIFQEIIFSNTSYAHSPFGNLEHVQSITNDDVKDYYSAKFKAPSITAVGAITQTEFSELFEKYFGGFFTLAQETLQHFTPDLRKRAIYLFDKKDSAQGEIRIGHISNKREEDFFAKLILNAVLGGQFSSRLMHNLREVKGYTYGVHSGFGYNKNLGSFEISTAVDIKNVAPAVSEIIKEVHWIKPGITEDELTFVKSYLTKRFPAQFETYSDIVANFSSIINNNLNKGYYYEYIQNIERVTRQDVLSAAQNRIDTDGLQIVIVGNLEQTVKISEKFSDWDIYEVDELGGVVRKIT